MENPVLLQLAHFIGAVCFGGMAGIWYDVCGLFAFSAGKFRRFAMDLVFWVSLFPAAFLFLLLLNGGGPRGYLLFGMGAGFALVRMTMGALLARALSPLRRKILAARRRKKAMKANRKAQKKEAFPEREQYGERNGAAPQKAKTVH